MILVAIVAEVLEEYTALLARVVEQVFRSAPVPRRWIHRSSVSFNLSLLPLCLPCITLETSFTSLLYYYVKL
ncbi:hypothetical protein D0Y65_031505 [Glycine soja]|uniref:Uncharacterized protein n=1 Tax=Glycine soja TaxID=3848 RepID=A0A445I8J4_GLYSO|nr:hypothetical protein D0Y65_031505 [Glycine soja]